jgi:hypothetical protein
MLQATFLPSTNLTRRTALTGGVAALVSTPAAALPSHPDAELLELGRQLERLLEQHRIENDRLDEIGDAPRPVLLPLLHEYQVKQYREDHRDNPVALGD